MKKLLLLPLCLISLMLVFSCKEKTRDEQAAEFQGSLTAADTLAMLNGCDTCMAMLSEGKIDQVLDMLYEYNDSTNEVQPLSEAVRASYKKMFTFFPVNEYTRDYFSFQLEGLNDVRYTVRFSADDEEEEAKTAFMFNPVRIDGEWYVTVKKADQEIDETHR